MTSDKIVVILLGLLTCAWIGDLIKGFYQRRKVQADSNLSDANATKVIIGTAATLLSPLKTRVEELEAEVAEAKSEVRKLVKQLQDATAENQRITFENQRVTEENKRVTRENRQLRTMLAGGST
jgi:hypothetical protein